MNIQKILIAATAVNIILSLVLGWFVLDTRRDQATNLATIEAAWNGLAAATIRIACETRVQGIINFDECSNALAQ